jgi:tetratricopeptide (TPR) repeat protein
VEQQVLENLITIAQRGKHNAEAAVNELLKVLQADQDYAPALVAVSIAYLTMRQAPRARNHLKRLAKMAYQPEFADAFELGWLLLAHVYIQAGKYDIAEELCNRCLTSNRSCARAYELLGTVKEKELSYADAAAAYKRAWLLEREAGAAVGFKLAFNLLKVRAAGGPPRLAPCRAPFFAPCRARACRAPARRSGRDTHRAAASAALPPATYGAPSVPPCFADRRRGTMWRL